MRRLLVNILSRLLYKERPASGMTREEVASVLARMHQQKAVHDYLNKREDYLIRQCVDQVLEDKLDGAKGFTGQILEIRGLRSQLLTSWQKSKALREARIQRAQDVDSE